MSKNNSILSSELINEVVGGYFRPPINKKAKICRLLGLIVSISIALLPILNQTNPYFMTNSQLDLYCDQMDYEILEMNHDKRKENIHSKNLPYPRDRNKKIQAYLNLLEVLKITRQRSKAN